MKKKINKKINKKAIALGALAAGALGFQVYHGVRGAKAGLAQDKKSSTSKKVAKSLLLGGHYGQYQYNRNKGKGRMASSLRTGIFGPEEVGFFGDKHLRKKKSPAKRSNKSKKK